VAELMAWRPAGGAGVGCHLRQSGWGGLRRSRGSDGRAPTRHRLAQWSRSAPSTTHSWQLGRRGPGHPGGGSTSSSGSGCG